jgi:hypothetical protein
MRLMTAPLVISLMLVSLISPSNRTLRAQDTLVTDASGEVSRPYPCWSGTMEFFGSYPYFMHDGYAFDANPFQVVQYREGNTAMIMVSSKGWRLVDMTRRKIWTDTRIYVQCRVISYPWGYNRTYAIVLHEYGMMEDCDDGPNRNPYDTGFDPYYETGDPDSGECGIGGTGSPEPPPNLPPGTICNNEWMAIDVSEDGGVTWRTIWEGIVKVCR